jgi:hypothetical protein
MGFKKGQPRPPNAGRKKGSLNKKTEALKDKCERLGVDPFEEMLMIIKTSGDRHLRMTALKEVSKYLYPVHRAVEHSGEINNPYASKSVEELEQLVKEKLND